MGGHGVAPAGPQEPSPLAAAAGSPPSCGCIHPWRRVQIPGDAADAAQLLHAVARLFVALPQAPGAAGPDSKWADQLATATLLGASMVGQLVQALLQHHSREVQPAQQGTDAPPQSPRQRQQRPAVPSLGEAGLQLAAQVLCRVHWLLGELAAFLAGGAQPGGIGSMCMQQEWDAERVSALHSLLGAAEEVACAWDEPPLDLEAMRGSGAAFCAGAAAAEAALRLQPLLAQLASAACSVVPGRSPELAADAAELPSMAAGYHANCARMVDRLTDALQTRKGARRHASWRPAP